MSNKLWECLARGSDKYGWVKPFLAGMVVGTGVLALVLVLMSAGGKPTTTADRATYPPENDGEVAADTVLKFATLSDTHIKKNVGVAFSDVPEQRLARIGNKLRSEDLDFVLINGDLVADLYGNPGIPDTNTNDVAWKFGSLIHNNFDPDVPVHVALGNHDNRKYRVEGYEYFRGTAPAFWNKIISNSALAPLQYPDATMIDTSAGSPADRNYYAWRQKGFNIIVLNSSAADPAVTGNNDKTTAFNDGMHFGAEQLAWLDIVLSEQGADGQLVPAIIFWHSAEWLPGVNDTDPVWPMVKHKDHISAIFTGHTHEFKKRVWHGIPVYTTTTAACATKWKWEELPFSNKDGWVNKGDAEPDYPPYFLVSADATAVVGGKKGTVEIDNWNEIFKYPTGGVNDCTRTDNTCPPDYCHIPGDS